MKARQTIAARGLFHLLYVPFLLSIFGNPVRGSLFNEETQTQYIGLDYEPIIEYILFAIGNLFIQPLLTYLIYNEINPNYHSKKNFILSTLLGIVLFIYILFVLKPQITENILATFLTAIGFGVYLGPLILVAMKRSHNETNDKHILLIPAIITIISICISGIIGALDARTTTKFFPNPAYKALVIGGFISDLYVFIHVFINDKDTKKE